MHMIVLAKGSINRPDLLAPHVGDEMRVGQLKAEGVIKSAYRRAAAPGVYVILEGSSIDAVRERVDTLPLGVEGLLTFDFDEIYEI
jgi:predicted homoserine dehydrogenase-like protein